MIDRSPLRTLNRVCGLGLLGTLLGTGPAWALSDAGLPQPQVSLRAVVAGQDGMLPTNGVVQIHYDDGIHEAGLPINLVVTVEALTPTPQVLAGQLVRNPTETYMLWWVPDTPYVEGTTYRITVSENHSQPPVELAQMTFTVGGARYGFPELNRPLAWCFEAGARYECLHPDPETGTCSVLDYVGPEERVRLELPGPDIEGLARVGRWVELRIFDAERWHPFRAAAGNARFGNARFVAQETGVEPCVELRMMAIGGEVIDQARRCGETPLSLCADVDWPKDVAPHRLRDAAVPPDDTAEPLDAGLGADPPAAADASAADGCQASVPPVSTGLFGLLLLGLRRRRGR